MRYLLFLLLLASLYPVSESAAQIQDIPAAIVGKPSHDTVSLEQLVAMDKKKFRGKTVQEFLDSKEASGYSQVKFWHTAEGMLQGLKLKYSDKLFLNVYVTEFNFLKPESPEKKWDYEALKKESIDKISVVFVMHD